MDHLTSSDEALHYHRQGRPGKIEVVPTKPCLTQIDLSLAYSPGVAEPCIEIAKDPAKVFEYTAKGNLVAVVSDGTAVLGLGDIGPNAAKPVMEGKGVLFKRFADIDVFDIELGTKDVDEIVSAVKAISPTVSGINLEDISAPRCFEIEKRLQKECDIPVFHDDQHGTALITGAALINALEIAEKDIEKIKVVVNGAGAAAVACSNFAISLGVRRENILMCDSKGVLYEGRTEGMNEFKKQFTVPTKARSLADAMIAADVFIGVSVANTVTPDMLLDMAQNPIVLAMANPDPEISYPLATQTRTDVIMATGRSDYPNQVNNVLGFPFVFRGALDVQATSINTEMMHAAAHALAKLAKEPVPSSVAAAYGKEKIEFGREYLIPKPLDHRVLRRVSAAVAKAAMESGVARKTIDLEEYERVLGEKLGPQRELMRNIVAKARLAKKRIVYPEGAATRILIAAQAVVQENIATPVLLGNKDFIKERANEIDVSLDGVEIIDPSNSSKIDAYANEFQKIRDVKEGTEARIKQKLLNPLWYGPMMLRMGDADGLVSGVTKRVRESMPPMLKTVPLKRGVRLACGLSIVFTRTGPLFLADTSVNIDPSAEDLAEIAVLAADEVKTFGITPTIAMVSFSTAGGTSHPRIEKIRRAVQIVKEEAPDLIIDGEMRVDAALSPIIQAGYENLDLGQKAANVLIFPSLEASNIAFNLLRSLTDFSTVGPMMLGFERPAHLLQPHSYGVSDVVHMTALASFSSKSAPTLSDTLI